MASGIKNVAITGKVTPFKGRRLTQASLEHEGEGGPIMTLVVVPYQKVPTRGRHHSGHLKEVGTQYSSSDGGTTTRPALGRSEGMHSGQSLGLACDRLLWRGAGAAEACLR